MNLKASFFNKTIFKSDIKRCWWIAILEALILFFSTVWPIYSVCKRYSMLSIIGASYPMVMPDWIYRGGIVAIVAFSVGVPIMLFSYLHFSSQMSMLHGLPVKRSELLWTKTITGLILTISPIILNVIAFGVIIINPLYRDMIGIMPIAEWCISGILYTLVIFTLTIAVNLMSGHPVGALIFTGGVMLLPLLLTEFISSFLQEELFGYGGRNVEEWLKYIYPSQKELMTFPAYIVYILMAVAFMAIAYFLYKHRKLENHGEVIAFSWLRPVFIGIVSILSSMLSWAYFLGVHQFNGVWWMIPIGVLGTVIAWMVSRKSLKLKGVHKPIGIYIAAALLVCMSVHFDITGFETRVPDAIDVESIQLGHKEDYIRTAYYDGGEAEYKLKGGIDTAFREAEDINNVIALHKYIVDTKFEPQSHARFMPIEYTLQNGRKFIREYYIDYEVMAEYLKPVYETPQMRAVQYELVDGTEKQYKSFDISDRRINRAIYNTSYQEPHLGEMVEALKKDIETLSYEDMFLPDSSSIVININYSPEVDYITPIPEGTVIDQSNCISIPINKAFKNTMKLIEEIGFLDFIPKAQDIESVTVYTWSGDRYPRSTDEYSVVSTTTNSEEIARLYAEYDGMIQGRKFSDRSTAKNIRVEYTLTGYTFEVSCSYDEDKIPEALIKYFE